MNLNQLKILLADDDTDDCLFFEDAIGELKPPPDFMAVHDGEQLMQLLMDKTYQLPDVLFLDLNMPRKNGFECLIEIKQNKKLSKLPVVVFSTSFEQEVVDGLFEKGAKYFIRKPSEFSLYKKIIMYTLKLIMKKDNSQITKDNFVLTVEFSLIV